MTIGIQPTWACPGFGYIEQGAACALDGAAAGGPGVFEVTRFREKPDAELAEQFLKQGNFRWNAGMFIWSIPAIMAAFNRHASVLGEFVGRLHAGENIADLLRDVFPGLPKISIDYAVMEKTERVLMVEAGFDWDDVGSWTAVAKYLAADAAGNQANTVVQAIDAANNIVFTDQPRTIALLGVSDLIVVQTADALLVCSRHASIAISGMSGKRSRALKRTQT